MAKVYTEKEIYAIRNRKVFFDANILIYLFGFFNNGKYFSNKYASIYGKLLNQKNDLFVDFIVVSEFVNRAERLEYDNYIKLNKLNKSSFNYKSFRNTKDGQEAIKGVYISVETHILNRFNFIGNAFSKDDILSFLKTDSLDFNDKAIYNTCYENNLVLLTNDADFKLSEIDIITANNKFIN